MTRIAITGGPKTGKTTLAKDIFEVWAEDGRLVERALDDFEIRHTDDLIGKLDWSDASAEIATWFDDPGPWIIEGVAVSRALRKWMANHPGERPPVDRVIYLSEPHESLSTGQASMAKGVRKVHDEIEPWLNEHGIRTEYR